MPIHVKPDIKRYYKFGDNFSLGDTPVSKDGPTIRKKGGSYLGVVRDNIADQNWGDFYNAWGPNPFTANRDVAKTIALQFDMRQDMEDTFDELWEFPNDARKFECDQKDALDLDLDRAYGLISYIANFKPLTAPGTTIKEPTFLRMPPARSDSKIVIFSDFHMTKLPTLPNYFFDFKNDQLYLQVLDHYYDKGYTLIENGDVEDCVLFEPTLPEAQYRTELAPYNTSGKFDYPIPRGPSNWSPFLQQARYATRIQSLQAVVRSYKPYYEKIRKFMAEDRYVRLSGNHDTYETWDEENTLTEFIQGDEGLQSRTYGIRGQVWDVVQILRGNEVKYLVLHGHQFDRSCMGHGDIPWAKTLGEIYTESLGWATQGADRIWRTSDTKRWYFGDHTYYRNFLAWSNPQAYLGRVPPCDTWVSAAAWDLYWGDMNNIKNDAMGFVETLLGNEVAWEYFENSDAFNAFALEVVTGDEMYKLRHMDEVTMCREYRSRWQAFSGNAGKKPPTLVMGHTHEPRQNAAFFDMDKDAWAPCDYYLNSGSAGRYENLIWGVEIHEHKDRIVSWSTIDGVATKTKWKSITDPNDSNFGRLLHDID